MEADQTPVAKECRRRTLLEGEPSGYEFVLHIDTPYAVIPIT
jgi:hypothetical protein